MSLPAAAVALLMTGPSVPDAPVHFAVDTAAEAGDLQVGNPQVGALQLAALQPADETTPPVSDPAAPVNPAPVNPAPTVPDASAPAASATPPEAASDEPESVIVVTAPEPAPPGDPLQKLNIESFKAVQAVDQAVLEPVAKAYNKGLPRPVRQGLRNFFTNLSEPVVFAAYLLQFKPGKAAETAGRFAINTTLGVAGLVDVAKKKPFNLPYRPNGLANTLGYYGVGPGPFFYLPIVGPTTLRDIIGDSVDRLLVPAVVGKPFTNPAVVLPMTIVDQLGERAAFDERINKIRKEDKPYAAYRELYLRQRKAEIEALHGRITPDVVPVYGPSMKTADNKDEAKAKEAEAEAEAEAKAKAEATKDAAEQTPAQPAVPAPQGSPPAAPVQPAPSEPAPAPATTAAPAAPVPTLETVPTP
ncbi:MlaA family lipoprotein [Novosphingobium sp.]|uniref:MlaA family lipoprotein n=1 Tax=Novosphingobium sp. TaxID=1874826 RepID=UPI003D6CF87A